MATTYTNNLHLGLQEDKSDNFDWDVITDNWLKIDAALGKAMPIPTVNCNPIADGTDISVTGVATYEEVN